MRIMDEVAAGVAVKTLTVPFHTWLSPAHTEAPAASSAILAGVMLKMGTYGFVRIAMPMLPGPWQRYALAFVIIGVVSVLYGALVALGQTSFKRMIAYTSVGGDACDSVRTLRSSRSAWHRWLWARRVPTCCKAGLRRAHLRGR
jgi:NADH:ubiquinone oxidoreductase subunit 4 (subunit M)